MDQNQEIEDLEFITEDGEPDETESVDEFIRTLEEKEKDLHITAETTVIELAESFDEPGELPAFLKEEIAAAATHTIAAAGSSPARDSGTIARLESKIDVLTRTIAKLEDERDEILQASLRRAKDFENFKARTERERTETLQNQIGNLAAQLLPALDNLNRAVDFALAIPECDRGEVQQFLDGVVLVSRQVSEVLAGMGIRPIESVGEAFNPHFHEAVATEETDEFPEGVISTEILKGYRIGERVVRHSMVKVARPPLSEPPA